MNTNIKKPSSASRRWRATRKKPSVNPPTKRSRKGPKTKKTKWVEWVESATYSRGFSVRPRSKYEPHVGNKQIARRTP